MHKLMWKQAPTTDLCIRLLKSTQKRLCFDGFRISLNEKNEFLNEKYLQLAVNDMNGMY